MTFGVVGWSGWDREGGQGREMPERFGVWSAVHDRFRQWRDAGVFEALLEGVIAEAAERGGVDLSLASVDSTTARAHHDAAGMRLEEGVLDALEKARQKRGRATEKRPSPLLPSAAPYVTAKSGR
ncbi:transposase [Streptomyces varsoviensis]|uniref:transposase n=1 Tax=Streptomyces varsoviensis TaxID=67373 RepID=UPI003F4CE075